MTVGYSKLGSYLNKNIRDICPNHFDDNNLSHCAHFVSHVLGIASGYTCDRMVRGSNGAKANIRVQELFGMWCPEVGAWALKPLRLTQGLIFVTDPRNVNVTTKKMDNVTNKHVGIFVGNNVWHYSKSQKKVVYVTTAQFSNIYPGVKNGLFYGTFK